MNITVAKRDLLTMLNRANGIAEKKGTMPVLSRVLLDATTPELRIAATDLYLSLSARIPSEMTKPGTIAVSCKDLLDRIKMMPDGPTILQDGPNNSLVMKTQGHPRRYTLRGMPGDDFPPLPKPADGAPTMTLDAGILSALIAKTRYSVSTDETRAHLNSAKFEWDGDTVRMVSTDGHRLALAEMKVKGTGTADLLIPLKALNELRAMADAVRDQEDPTLSLIHAGPTLFVQRDGATFTIRLTDAQFPPYRQVIPQSSALTVRVPRAALADAIKAVAVAAAERTGGVKFTLSKGTMRITSESPDSGDGADELPYDVVDGKDGAMVGMNARYPLDVLEAMASESEVLIGLGGELDPLTVRPVDKGEGESVAVVMPMRI